MLKTLGVPSRNKHNTIPIWSTDKYMDEDIDAWLKPIYVNQSSNHIEEKIQYICKSLGIRLGLTRRDIELLISHPINPKANIEQALSLTAKRTGFLIDNMLRSYNVVEFTAIDVINLTDGQLFFYLTRFYGPPPPENISVKTWYIVMKYRKKAANKETQRLVDALEKQIDLYMIYKETFDKFFYFTLADSTAWKHLDALNENIFLNSPFSYFHLLNRSNNLPSLSTTFINICSNREDMYAILNNYTDREILNGMKELNLDEEKLKTREELINNVIDRLTSCRFMLLSASEAKLCNNKKNLNVLELVSESDEVFIGLDNDCFSLQDLFNTWGTVSTDYNEVKFVNPLDINVNWSSHNLEQLYLVLKQGKVKRYLLDEFFRFIRVAKMKEEWELNKIDRIRRTDDKDALRQYLINLFNLAMLMKGWKGSGTPYPKDNLVEDEEYRLTLSNASPKEDTERLILNLTAMRMYKGKEEATRWKLREVINNEKIPRELLIDLLLCSSIYYLRLILNERIPGCYEIYE